MECTSGYIKFFRVRSRVRVIAIGDHTKSSWIAQSIVYMDFNHEILLEETIATARQFPGTFSYKGLSQLPFDRYEKIIECVMEAEKNGR